MRFRFPFVALAALVLAACQPEPAPPVDAAAEPAPATTDDVAAPSHTFGPDISAEDFAEHVKTLASDAFEGRAPGSRGEDLTVDYLQRQFQRLGLRPGNGDSYVQVVPMVETTADPNTKLELAWPDGTRQTLAFGSDMVIGTTTGQPQVSVSGSELVFVGYGVDAPEAGWNDYSIDVRGKTVVMLVNDPGFHAGDESLFQGKRMTYYGRWSYKFEEAIRHGAAAALIIHDDAGAGYGWDVVQHSWSGAQFDLPAADDPAPRLPLQGWISGPAAQAVFERSGLQLDQLRAAANRPGFTPVPLNATLTTTLNSAVAAKHSRNVLGLLPGTEQPDEAVVYMAHWDHLGRNPALEGDQIFNGAVDNATGVAGILEIAEMFVTQQPAPRRSVLFLAVTLEESGLLGSKYYVAHPTVPLANTVGVINLDAMTMVGKVRDLVVIGRGNSELEDILQPIAAAQGRTLEVERAVEKGFYYRSDHFNFAKAGVPALYAKGGFDHVEHGEAHGIALSERYTAERYHKPGDEYDPAWDLTGVVDDLDALYRVGRELVYGEQWPNWYAGNEFRAARDAQRPPAAAQGGK